MIQLPSVISQIRTLADGAVRVVVDLQETSPENIAELFKLKGGYGHFLFKEKVITEDDVKDLPDFQFQKWEKHPSQRMRAVIWHMWNLTDKSKTEEQFYRETMEKIIDWLKTKLD